LPSQATTTDTDAEMILAVSGRWCSGACPPPYTKVEAAGVDHEGNVADDAELQHFPVEDVDRVAQALGFPRVVTIVEPNWRR